MMFRILAEDGRTPVEIDVWDDLGYSRTAMYQWVQWQAKHGDVRLGRYEFADGDMVSTVFVATGPHPFETGVFFGKEVETYYWPTWEAALEGHDRLLEELKRKKGVQ